MRPLPRPLSKVSLRTYTEVARIGQNLNQLTRAVNLALKLGKSMPSEWVELNNLSTLLRQLQRELADSTRTNEDDFDDEDDESDREAD